jgi:hypothetical protein
MEARPPVLSMQLRGCTSVVRICSELLMTPLKVE